MERREALPQGVLSKMADEQLRQAQIPKNQKAGKKAEVAKTPVKSEGKKAEKEDKPEKIKEEETGEKKETKKQPAKPAVKKTEAIVFSRNVPVSKKYSIAIGKFIKNLPINESIRNLEKVRMKKLVVPMKGELAHRKGKKLNGKRMSSGRYPVRASGYFIKLLKTLIANSALNGLDLDKTKISEVIVNKGPQQLHRFGRTEMKRTHILIKAKEFGEKV